MWRGRRRTNLRAQDAPWGLLFDAGYRLTCPAVFADGDDYATIFEVTHRFGILPGILSDVLPGEKFIRTPSDIGECGAAGGSCCSGSIQIETPAALRARL